MSNVNNPNGLHPTSRRLGGGFSELWYKTKAAAYGYAIRKWDQVTIVAGVLNGPGNGITPGTTRLAGVAASYSPASTLESLGIFGHPDDVFDVQEDNSGAANLVAAKLNYNGNLTTSAGGTPLTEQSGVQLSGTSINTTSSLDVRILQLLADPTNDYGAYGRVEVLINKHQLNRETTTT